MSRSIKTFTIKYNSINEHNTFTNGDTIQGRIILELSKELRIDKLFIKCKGGADVHWTDSSSSSSSDSYRSHQRYFKLKQIFIWDNSKIGQDGAILLTNWEKYGNLIMPGHHTFPFSFQLPETNMPPSFKGSHGSIKYVLEAKLHRSWSLKIPETVVNEFTFVSKVPDTCALLMQPLSGSVEQKMKFFTSGSASIKASTDKKGYMQGERIKVETHIENSSSRALKLKFKLKQKQTFTAQSRHNYAKKVIFKAVEDPIPSRSKKTFTSRLKLPSNLNLTITNCSIISVEYFLKVYLDVPYDIDPYIVFPLVIIPAGQYSIPQQNQVDYQASQNRQESAWMSSRLQPELFASPHVPAATAFGLAPNLYPSMLAPPANPAEPPPSYTDIFPDSNPSASGFNPSLLPLCPPPYTTMVSSHTSHQHTSECPTPESPSSSYLHHRL